MQQKITTKRAYCAAIIACLASASITGCNVDVEDQSPADDIAEVAEALDKDEGGLTMTDELPQFGNPDAFVDAGLAEPEVVHDDELAAATEVAQMKAKPNMVAFRAKLLWGQIPANRDNEKARNWSGTISLNRGAIIVRRRIRFEPRTDRVLPRVDPRVDPRVVKFLSKTRPHHEGLRVELIDPTPEADQPLVLTYRAEGGLVLKAKVSSLLDGPKTLTVDDAGNRMIAKAKARPLDSCAHGSLHGRWHRLAEGRGRFIGLVLNANEDPIGHMRGVYGRRTDGKRVFFGKYINLKGKFKGIFKGHYGAGKFKGRWKHKNGDKGVLGGAYWESVPGPEVGGHFMGRWREKTCNLPAGAAELPVEIQ